MTILKIDEGLSPTADIITFFAIANQKMRTNIPVLYWKHLQQYSFQHDNDYDIHVYKIQHGRKYYHINMSAIL